LGGPFLTSHTAFLNFFSTSVVAILYGIVVVVDQNV